MIKLTKDKISLADAFKVVEAVMKGEEIRIEGTSSYFTTSYNTEDKGKCNTISFR